MIIHVIIILNSSLNIVNWKGNTMKFMIITTNGTYIKESENFENVAKEIYDFHPNTGYVTDTGYDNIVGIIKVE